MAVLMAKTPSEHECVCDQHGALTNLAWCIKDECFAVPLFNRLQRVMYSDDIYQASAAWLAEFEARHDNDFGPQAAHPDWAYHYFIGSWMGRNGVAGTASVNYQIATRWTQGGGSGPLRFRNAVDSIPEWADRLRNVHILRRSVFDVLPKIEDSAGVAIYVDPPYLHSTVAGNSRYLYDFGPREHEKLATELRRFKCARIVVSYYAAPELQLLYQGWTILDCARHKHLHCQNKRGSKRSEAPEVLIVNGDAFHDSNDGQLFLAE